MNYKNIFKIIIALISSPAKAWEDICVNQDSQKVIVDFVYPMIGICGIVWFGGSLYRLGWSTPMAFQKAMIDCCGVAVALFGGFFLSIYLLSHYVYRWFNLNVVPQNIPSFVGYAMTITFVANIITGIYPPLQAISNFLHIYAVYIIYMGATPMMKVEASQRISFTISSSIVILVCPALIGIIFQNLIAILN